MACGHYTSIHLERDGYTALILLPVNIIRAVTKQWRIHGRGRAPLPYFLDQTEARRDEQNFFFLDQASPYPLTGFGWPLPPPPLCEGLDPPLLRGTGLEFSPAIKGMTPGYLQESRGKQNQEFPPPLHM